MTEITKLLPTESKTVEAIYDAHKKRGDSEKPRGYLGASIIGHSCERYLWYTFRFCCQPEFSGRMYRLFETGDCEEARFVNDLRSIGCTVHDTDESGQQFAVSALGGHFSGHMDGCILGVMEAPKTWHVCEFKTHCNKSFTKLKRDGVKKAKPQHYAQMMVYMGLAGVQEATISYKERIPGMTRALYLAVNKDTDELYSERVRFDKAEFDALMERAERIITATAPPARISERPDYYECSYCDAKEICFGSDKSALPIPAINCRQCCHATPQMDGNARWTCSKHGRGLSDTDQNAACGDHLVLPGLIHFADPINASSDHIEFDNRNEQQANTTWTHGKGGFATKELMVLPISALTNPMLTGAKELFGSLAEKCGMGIICRYPESDSRIIWRGKQDQLTTEWNEIYKIHITQDSQLAKEDGMIHQAVEFEGGRIAIIWTDPLRKADYDAEIREGIS
jgi:hypothetical protein